MTREELRKEATMTVEWECTPMIDRPLFVHAYITGAEPREKRIAELEKEIAELDCQKNRNKACYSCANVTERCFKNEIGCPCEKYKSYKDENAELKDKLEVLIAVGNTCTKGLNEQLTKAKEILEDIIKFQPYIDRDAMFLTCGNDWKEVIFKAEQFIKDSEVKK